MRTIHKYKLEGLTDLLLPYDAKILHVDSQDDAIYLWALVNTEALREPRRFVVYSTGREIRFDLSELRYVNTFFMCGGSIVLHAFEVLAPPKIGS